MREKCGKTTDRKGMETSQLIALLRDLGLCPQLLSIQQQKVPFELLQNFHILLAWEVLFSHTCPLSGGV